MDEKSSNGDNSSLDPGDNQGFPLTSCIRWGWGQEVKVRGAQMAKKTVSGYNCHLLYPKD